VRLEGGGRRILVVEDDTPLRNALVSTVQAAGYEVVAVGDGAPAVQALHS
jgi:CheY-like chemotaxis protein